jgi:hypothetical protein
MTSGIRRTRGTASKKRFKEFRRNSLKRLELCALIDLTFIKHFAIYYSDRGRKRE